jgi:hypothetical protein
MYTGPIPFNRREAERQQREAQEGGEQRRDFNTPLLGSKPSPYRLPVLLGAAGVILLVLGFIIGWTWLVLLGFALLLAAAFSVRLWFLWDWTPTLFAEKAHDEDPWHILPPPTLEDRS